MSALSAEQQETSLRARLQPADVDPTQPHVDCVEVTDLMAPGSPVVRRVYVGVLVPVPKAEVRRIMLDGLDADALGEDEMLGEMVDRAIVYAAAHMPTMPTNLAREIAAVVREIAPDAVLDVTASGPFSVPEVYGIAGRVFDEWLGIADAGDVA